MKTASVTVNWGPPDDTIVALQSLASMTRPPDFIVCVDNGSPSADLSRLRAGMPKDTVLIELGDNIGVAAANNAGMDYALSHDVDWTLLLNNDATVEAQCLDRCIAEATASPHIAIVGAGCHFHRSTRFAVVRGGQRERLVCLPASPWPAPARGFPTAELRRWLCIHLLRAAVVGGIPIDRPISV